MMSSRKDFFRVVSRWVVSSTQRIAQQRVVAGGSRTVGGGDRREGRRSEDRVDPGVEKRILLLFRTCFGGRGAVGFPLKAPNLPAGFAAGFLYGLRRSAVGRCLAFGCRGMPALRPAAPCRAPEAGRAAGVLPRRYILPLACPKFQKKSYLCRRVGKTARKWLRRPQCGGFNIRQI